jgi:ubiquinone/menaquinone biosynthesis C-methylase UbiE
MFGGYYAAPSWFDRTFRAAIYLRAMLAVDTARELGAPSVLDIGSGPGANSIALIKQGGAAKLLGIDFAPTMIELARQLAAREGVADRCEFVDGDFTQMDLPDAGYDLSVALGVFDYVAEPLAFLERMRRVSRRAMVASWPENGLRMMLRQARYTCPVHPYTEAQIRDLHRLAGVTKLDVVRIPAGWVTKAWL